jgi:hypothetical protein
MEEGSAFFRISEEECGALYGIFAKHQFRVNATAPESPMLPF